MESFLQTGKVTRSLSASQISHVEEQKGIQVKETIDDPYDPRILCQNYCNLGKKNKRFGGESEEDGDIFAPVSVDLSPSVREKQRYNLNLLKFQVATKMKNIEK